MKKLLIIALCFTFLNCTHGNKNIRTATEVSYDHYTGEKYLVKSKIASNTKTVVGYNSDSKIVFKGKYVNDKREGEWLEYYEDGSLEFKWNFKKDKLHGEHIRYYKNGNIMFIGHYKNGILHGDYIHYYKDGTIKSFEKFCNGKVVE